MEVGVNIRGKLPFAVRRGTGVNVVNNEGDSYLWSFKACGL